MTDRYLMDTVTLSKMSPDQRSSEFMRTWCRVPAPVLYEARGLPDAAALRDIEYCTTIQVLQHVQAVVAGLAEGDRLLDLYRNEGNGDVFLLAVALVEADIAASQLFGDRWVIVTDDKRLTDKAGELDVATLSSTRFIALLP
jgi:hypothetical protein